MTSHQGRAVRRGSVGVERMRGYIGSVVRSLLPLALLFVSAAPLAQSADYYEVSGAPPGCSASYVFPRSAPMMAEGYGKPYTVVPAKLEGVEWGSCSKMTPHDGTQPVWSVTLWQPGFRGNAFCSLDGKISDVLVVGDPATPANADVKARWYDSKGLTPGTPPQSTQPCPAGAPPEPDPAAVAALREAKQPPPPEPEKKEEERTHRLSVAGQLEAGKSYALGGFTIGGRLGLGSSSKHSWIGGALQVNTWQAVPVVNEWFYQTTAIMPAFWAVWKVDPRGQLRVHGLVGAGPVRYQRAWNDEETGESHWSAGSFVSAQVSYRIVSLGASVYGPGTHFCDDSADCDIPIDLQLTLGVLIFR
jgi:hypothetical protein